MVYCCLQLIRARNFSTDVSLWAKEASEHLNIRNLDEWYKIDRKTIQSLPIWEKYPSLKRIPVSTLLTRAYPSHTWETWRFKAIRNFWAQQSNRREAFDAAMASSGMTQLADWYRVSRRDMYRMGIGGILANFYGNSPLRALTDIYPEHTWLPWMFTQSRSFWKHPKNHQIFFQWASRQLGISDLAQWYSVSRLKLDGASDWVRTYGGSLPLAVMNSSPNHYEWKPWLFASTPRSAFDNPSTRRAYMEWLASRLGFERMEKWYNVTKEDFEKNYGASLLNAWFDNSPSRAVTETFPEHAWELSHFGASRRTSS